MSNSIIDYIFIFFSHYSHFLPWISFGVLLLAGFNLPISEDLILILSGAISAIYAPELEYFIFIGCFAGAFISDIMSYFIGKYFIHRIVNSSVLSHIFHPERIDKINGYFRKYGEKVIFFGRFIPFGVRNLVFMTSGLTRVPLKHFLIIDLLALSITSTVLFKLGVMFGEDYASLFRSLNKYKLIFAVIAVAIITIIVRYELIIHRRKKSQN
ncbi:MAG: DedA family protein [Spirochaetes bacterium]|jgi:membrane-associated protein|nr:DedA family protein [Spirochaetota bacterium]